MFNIEQAERKSGGRKTRLPLYNIEQCLLLHQAYTIMGQMVISDHYL